MAWRWLFVKTAAQLLNSYLNSEGKEWESSIKEGIYIFFFERRHLNYKFPFPFLFLPKSSICFLIHSFLLDSKRLGFLEFSSYYPCQLTLVHNLKSKIVLLSSWKAMSCYPVALCDRFLLLWSNHFSSYKLFLVVNFVLLNNMHIVPFFSISFSRCYLLASTYLSLLYTCAI